MGAAIINLAAFNISLDNKSKAVDLLLGRQDISVITSARVIGLSSSDLNLSMLSSK